MRPQYEVIFTAGLSKERLTMTLRYEKRNGIAYFTFDNGKVNALTPQMHKDFYLHLRAFEIDDEVRVGILSSDPGKPFSAGDDLKNRTEPERTRQQELEAYLFLHQHEGDTPSRPGWDLDVLQLQRSKPIIAAIHGYCLGKGLIYVLQHTDIRIASHDARFGLPEIAYGMGGASGTTRLARHIPRVEAAWLALTGAFIDAQEALRIHLINRVVPAAELMQAAEQAAALIARHPAIAVRVEMEALDDGWELSRQDAVRHTQNLYRLQRMGYEGFGADPTEILRRKQTAD
jgi:enoyl-CoA hydratase/carnithine racemase